MKANEADAAAFEVLFLFGFVIVACALLMYNFELYRISPFWGPIRKFESPGNEDLRINQLLVHRHMADLRAQEEAKKKEEEKHNRDVQEGRIDDDPMKRTYGSMGPSTWGHCEAPWMWGERSYHPQHGQVVIRHGFSDTQYMREHVGTWPRDEVHFMREQGIRSLPPMVNESSENLGPQVMV
eukprot:TRINITY_DN25958_c0_g1_i1.p2 TRINITY_DN25958_c0_g1~~TRINITY_DN25958_c0_g1_i1.p2  ORF type:complete len:182 (-),score=44.76 TRINITY_DN25958_c0_g1_i1:163-708(-)